MALVCASAGVLLTCDTTPGSAAPDSSAVESVFVAPRSGALHAGDSLQFGAWGRSLAGDSMGVPLSWSATGGTVFPDGRYYAPAAPGVYTVSAVFGFRVAGMATIVVRPADSLLMGVSLEPRSFDLHSGDTARIAAYALYAPDPRVSPVLTFPRLPVIPLFAATGGTITPDGLFTAGSDPGSFPIVARDSSGGFADTVWAQIQGPAVASVHVDPATSSVPAGRTGMLDASMADAQGNALEGRAVSWSSSAPGVATVLPAAGIVTGMAPGQAVITATSEGVSATATVTVTGPDSTFWPNEPVGFSLVTDQPWDLLTALDWFVNFGTAAITPDLSAPFSPPSVLTITYPIGFAGGEAPGTLTHPIPNLHSVYVGLWWKASSPWQGHNSNVNKIAFLFPASAGDMYLAMYGSPGGPYELRAITQFPGIEGPWLTPNVHNVSVSLGVWHRIEWLVVYNTSNAPANGVSRVWMDGVLISDYQNVQFPQDAGMAALKLSPTWGGVGDVKHELDFYWYDHTRVSGR